jgi:hypothetical protein
MNSTFAWNIKLCFFNLSTQCMVSCAFVSIFGAILHSFSNSDAFFSTAAGSTLIFSISQLMIQALACFKWFVPSSLRAIFMILSLLQQHSCIWVFWTKFLVLCAVGFISRFWYVQNDHIEQNISLFVLPIFRIVFGLYLYCVWSFLTQNAKFVISWFGCGIFWIFSTDHRRVLGGSGTQCSWRERLEIMMRNG